MVNDLSIQLYEKCHEINRYPAENRASCELLLSYSDIDIHYYHIAKKFVLGTTNHIV